MGHEPLLYVTNPSPGEVTLRKQDIFIMRSKKNILGKEPIIPEGTHGIDVEKIQAELAKVTDKNKISEHVKKLQESLESIPSPDKVEDFIIVKQKTNAQLVEDVIEIDNSTVIEEQENEIVGNMELTDEVRLVDEVGLVDDEEATTVRVKEAPIPRKKSKLRRKVRPVSRATDEAGTGEAQRELGDDIKEALERVQAGIARTLNSDTPAVTKKRRKKNSIKREEPSIRENVQAEGLGGDISEYEIDSDIEIEEYGEELTPRKSFKEMTNEEKVEAILYRPHYIPRVQSLIKTKQKTYVGNIMKYENKKVYLTLIMRLETVILRLEDIQSIQMVNIE